MTHGSDGTVSLLIPAAALLIHQFVRRTLDAGEPQSEPALGPDFFLAKAA